MREELIRLRGGIIDPRGMIFYADEGDCAKAITRHPEVLGGLPWMIEAVENPDAIWQAKGGGNRIIYDRTFTDRFGRMIRVMLVANSIHDGAYKFKTWMVPPRRYWQRHAGRRLWARDEEPGEDQASARGV